MRQSFSFRVTEGRGDGGVTQRQAVSGKKVGMLTPLNG